MLRRMTMGDAWKNIEELYSDRKFEEAIVGLNALEDEHLNNPDFYEKRALCYFHLGQKERSIADFDKAQQIDPNNPYRYSSRAFAKGAAKDIEGAIEDYKKAIHLDPQDAIAHNNLGLLLEQKGYMRQAKQSFDQSDELIGRKTPEIPEQKAEQESVEEENPNTAKLISSVFTQKSVFKEFLRFIKNGFKIKD